MGRDAVISTPQVVVAAELESIVFVLRDVAKEKHILNLVDLAVRKYGQIDSMFNCIVITCRIDTAPALKGSGGLGVPPNAGF